MFLFCESYGDKILYVNTSWMLSCELLFNDISEGGTCPVIRLTACSDILEVRHKKLCYVKSYAYN